MTTLKVKEGMAFVVTTESDNIDVLREASEKYGVHIPDVKFIVVCYDDLFELYYELEGYGRTENAFACPWSSVNQANGFPENCREQENARLNVMSIIAENMDNLYWGDILTEYLAEDGIDYEEQ